MAIANLKGGVSKTTTAVHLASWLNDRGHAVVFVNASFQKGVHNWLKGLEIPFYQEKDPDELFVLVESFKAEVDYVVVDLPGASEVLRVVLDCCHRLLVPISPKVLDLQDCIDLINIVRRKQRLRPDLRVSYFLSRIDSRSKAHLEVLSYFKQYQLDLLKTKIRELKIIGDSPAYQTTVFHLQDATAKKVARDYENLFEEFMHA